MTMALFKRDLKRWFANPVGYVVITVFVLIATILLFSREIFFLNNLANLDTLNAWFPYLLLFLIPAITMNLWSAERGHGTDELLLTLPATEGQLLLGKFLAAVGIYTVALVFSASQTVLLAYLGDPDWGLIFANYVGYWFLGIAFISAAMIGTMLSDNVIIAFILGALLCGVIIVAEIAVGLLCPSLINTLTGYGPVSFFLEFGRGVISLPSLLLYTGMTVGFLYFNLLLLRRRHWSIRPFEGVHLSVRFVCLSIGAVALTVIGVNRLSVRLDTTSERLHSLSPQTLRIIDEIPKDRVVFVQAYVSPEVPSEFAQTRRTLLNLLREFDGRGGGRVVVRVVETEAFTEASREAEKAFNIRHREITSEADRKSYQLFLAVAFTCGAEEVVIPFLDKGLSVEYELARSLRVAASAGRKRVGILETDAKLFGSFDFQTMQQQREWEIVQELRLQYEVERVAADGDYPKNLDALVVPLPSSLTQEEMNRLAMYIRDGNPTLLVDDPFAAYLNLAATDPKGGGQRSMFGPQQQPKPKGEIRGFLSAFGIRWNPSSILYGAYNPHPKYDIQDEIVFVCKGPEFESPFNERERISSGLQEVVCIIAGHLEDEGRSSEYEFIPLMRTSKSTGVTTLDELLPRSYFGRQRNPNPDIQHSYTEKNIACRIKGKSAADGKKPVNLICVADLDILSGVFFQFRREGNIEFNLDNVQFVLNCIDALVGDENFIDLRKRRPTHRTLARIEAQEKVFDDALAEEKRKAETKAKKDLEEAQQRLSQRITKIEQSAEGDEQEKEIKIRSFKEVEERKLDLQKAAIENEKERAIADAETVKKENVREIWSFYRFFAPFLTILPAILLGFIVFVRKITRGGGTVT